MQKNKGFTLIELLVVIAIIGILASVVLASLNSARAKGADAAIKSNLANMRAQAELYYDSNSSSYLGVCNTDLTNVKSLSDSIAAVDAAGGSATDCNDEVGGWAAISTLKSTGNWCVDSTGYSGLGTLGADATVCTQS
jgi:prepilin-type N-terminal cleavage/methylation domain-containing protein